jgi:hypothetical protein
MEAARQQSSATPRPLIVSNLPTAVAGTEYGTEPHHFAPSRSASTPIKHAQLLMLTTSRPLAQIALDCGLADQPHLTRLSPDRWYEPRPLAP